MSLGDAAVDSWIGPWFLAMMTSRSVKSVLSNSKLPRLRKTRLILCVAPRQVTIGTIVYEDLSCCPRANGPQ
jgi:hypothetical protein